MAVYSPEDVGPPEAFDTQLGESVVHVLGEDVISPNRCKPMSPIAEATLAQGERFAFAAGPVANRAQMTSTVPSLQPAALGLSSLTALQADSLQPHPLQPLMDQVMVTGSSHALLSSVASRPMVPSLTRTITSLETSMAHTARGTSLVQSMTSLAASVPHTHSLTTTLKSRPRRPSLTQTVTMMGSTAAPGASQTLRQMSPIQISHLANAQYCTFPTPGPSKSPSRTSIRPEMSPTSGATAASLPLGPRRSPLSRDRASLRRSPTGSPTPTIRGLQRSPITGGMSGGGSPQREAGSMFGCAGPANQQRASFGSVARSPHSSSVVESCGPYATSPDSRGYGRAPHPYATTAIYKNDYLFDTIAEDLFDMIDRDNDGRISQSEFKTALAKGLFSSGDIGLSLAHN